MIDEAYFQQLTSPKTRTKMKCDKALLKLPEHGIKGICSQILEN